MGLYKIQSMEKKNKKTTKTTKTPTKNKLDSNPTQNTEATHNDAIKPENSKIEPDNEPSMQSSIAKGTKKVKKAKKAAKPEVKETSDAPTTKETPNVIAPDAKEEPSSQIDSKPSGTKKIKKEEQILLEKEETIEKNGSEPAKKPKAKKQAKKVEEKIEESKQPIEESKQDEQSSIKKETKKVTKKKKPAVKEDPISKTLEELTMKNPSDDPEGKKDEEIQSEKQEQKDEKESKIDSSAAKPKKKKVTTKSKNKEKKEVKELSPSDDVPKHNQNIEENENKLNINGESMQENQEGEITKNEEKSEEKKPKKKGLKKTKKVAVQNEEKTEQSEIPKESEKEMIEVSNIPENPDILEINQVETPQKKTSILKTKDFTVSNIKPISSESQNSFKKPAIISNKSLSKFVEKEENTKVVERRQTNELTNEVLKVRKGLTSSKDIDRYNEENKIIDYNNKSNWRKQSSEIVETHMKKIVSMPENTLKSHHDFKMDSISKNSENLRLRYFSTYVHDLSNQMEEIHGFQERLGNTKNRIIKGFHRPAASEANKQEPVKVKAPPVKIEKPVVVKPQELDIEINLESVNFIEPETTRRERHIVSPIKSSRMAKKEEKDIEIAWIVEMVKNKDLKKSYGSMSSGYDPYRKYQKVVVRDFNSKDILKDVEYREYKKSKH